MSQAVGIRAKGGLNLREGVGDEPTACMGRLRFELRTNRLKAECSTAELATRARWAPNERITQG
jgi:hypothetical protein